MKQWKTSLAAFLVTVSFLGSAYREKTFIEDHYDMQECNEYYGENEFAEYTLHYRQIIYLNKCNHNDSFHYKIEDTRVVFSSEIPFFDNREKKYVAFFKDHFDGSFRKVTSDAFRKSKTLYDLEKYDREIHRLSERKLLHSSSKIKCSP